MSSLSSRVARATRRLAGLDHGALQRAAAWIRDFERTLDQTAAAERALPAAPPPIDAETPPAGNGGTR
jgi:hypothetical protein